MAAIVLNSFYIYRPSFNTIFNNSCVLNKKTEGKKVSVRERKTEKTEFY